MNIFKDKPNRVFFLSLILFFAAVHVHADTGKRSLFGENSGLFIVLPPLGAAILFKRSLNSRSFQVGNGLFNLSEGKLGLGIPDVHVRPLPAYGKNMKAEFQFKINMLSVVL